MRPVTTAVPAGIHGAVGPVLGTFVILALLRPKKGPKSQPGARLSREMKASVEGVRVVVVVAARVLGMEVPDHGTARVALTETWPPHCNVPYVAKYAAQMDVAGAVHSAHPTTKWVPFSAAHAVLAGQAYPPYMVR